MLVQAELLLIYKQGDVVNKYDIVLETITINYENICRKIKKQSNLPAFLVVQGVVSQQLLGMVGRRRQYPLCVQ